MVIGALRRPPRERCCFEPGRHLVGDAGVLLTRVEYLKPGDARNFAIVDAAMNDLLRPALYDAWHPVTRGAARATEPPRRWDIVGPVCESGDFWRTTGRSRSPKATFWPSRAAGAYAMAMSSNYNARPRACEVIVDDSNMHLGHAAASVRTNSFAGESRLP